MTYTQNKAAHQYTNTTSYHPAPIAPTYIRLDPPLWTTHPAAALPSVVGKISSL